MWLLHLSKTTQTAPKLKRLELDSEPYAMEKPMQTCESLLEVLVET